MCCKNCEPLYCRSCLANYRNNKCPTCNLDKNFSNAPLKLKNILKGLLIKGCPANGCKLENSPMTYEAVMNHLRHNCNKITGKCEFNCGKNLFRNEIDNHIKECHELIFNFFEKYY